MILGYRAVNKFVEEGASRPVSRQCYQRLYINRLLDGEASDLDLVFKLPLVNTKRCSHDLHNVAKIISQASVWLNYVVQIEIEMCC